MSKLTFWQLVLVSLIIIAALWISTAIFIWALSTLFMINIPYTWKTHLAAFLLMSWVFNGLRK